MAAVHDGFVLQKSVVHTPLAGALLSTCMEAVSEAKGVTIRPRYEFLKKEGAGGKMEVG